MTIKPPPRSDDYSDRTLDCEFALGPAFHELARQAEAAGWDEDAVSAALLALATNHIKGIMADRKTLADMNKALSRLS